MPVCVVKLCKNNTRNINSRNKKGSGITFHKFPADPVICDRWTAIVRLSREESWWKPGKHSVICSAHFNQSDMYYSKGFLKRLYKEAVPQNALFLSSMLPDNILNNSMVIAEPSTSAPVVEGTILTTGKTKNSQTPHEGYKCSECNLNIYGYRYTCLQCDYDICGSCEARGAHPLHYVLRVPGQRPHSETARVCERVRGVLRAERPAEQPAQEVPRHTTGDLQPEPEIIKLKVKEEIEDILDPLRLDTGVPDSEWRVPGGPVDQTTLQLDTVKTETIDKELIFEISPFTPTTPIASPAPIALPAPIDPSATIALPAPIASSAPIDPSAIIASSALIAPSAPPGRRSKRAPKRPSTDDVNSFTVFTHRAVKANKSEGKPRPPAAATVTIPLRNTQKKGRIFLPPGWPWN